MNSLTELLSHREGLDGLRRAYLGQKPRNDQELYNWLRLVLNLWMPRYQVCEDHQTPFEYFSDRFFDRATATILLGARTVGKSYNSGLECWTKARFNENWHANILAGSLEQGEKSYDATMDFWGTTHDIGGMDILVREPGRKETRLKNRSGYRILTASHNSVRGGHPPTVFLDEIDEIAPDIFGAALNQPQSKGDMVASWALTSTRHRAGGLMEYWVDHHDDKGLKLYVICILEAMEGCYDYNCSTCYLDQWCHGKMKPVMERAYKEQVASGEIERGQEAVLGFNTVEDVITKAKLGKVEESDKRGGAKIWFIDVDAELFCLRPSRIGLVYKEFNELQSGKANMEIPKEWRRYRSFDFGFRDPWVCLWAAEDPSNRLWFYDELYISGKTTHEMGTIVSGLHKEEKYEFNVADPSGAGDRATLLNLGIPTMYTRHEIPSGLNATRQYMKIRTDGLPGIYVDPVACPNLWWELTQGYRYSDRVISEIPEDENNHACDCVKNLIMALQTGTARTGKAKYR